MVYLNKEQVAERLAKVALKVLRPQQQVFRYQEEHLKRELLKELEQMKKEEEKKEAGHIDIETLVDEDGSLGFLY